MSEPAREPAPPARSRWWVRGAIWIALGAVAHVSSRLAGYPLVMRGTGWPWGYVVVGLGALLLVWDGWRARKGRA
jgi:hypothetical protein